MNVLKASVNNKTKTLKQKILIGISMLTVSLVSQANIVGTIGGKLSLGQGKLNYSVPLDVPKGANGMSPSLAIVYQQGKRNGALGLGFGLAGLSVLQRCAMTEKYDGKKGGVQFNLNDRYCLDGQRLILTNGSEGNAGSEYRTADNNYSKITFDSGDKWTIKGAGGDIYTYGGTENSKKSNSTSQTLAWYLSSQKDRHANKLTYVYKNDQRIESINYSGYKIVFNYEPLPSSFTNTTYSFGVKTELNSKLSSIDILNQSKQLRKYKLRYEAVNQIDSLRIAGISLCGTDGACTKELTFQYDPIINQNSNDTIDLLSFNDVSTYSLTDINFDGHVDVCYLKRGLYCSVNDGNSNFTTSKWTNKLDANKWNQPEQAGALNFIDLNNDSYPDYCMTDSTGIFCGLNNKNGGFEQEKYWTTAYNNNVAVRYNDINNDGYIDLCKVNASNITCSISHPQSGSYGAPFELLNDSWPLNAQKENGTVNFIDINGDRLVDICGMDDTGYSCALNTGLDVSGDKPIYQAKKSWVASSTFGKKRNDNKFAFSLRHGDLNADGLTDICYVDGANLKCRTNTGTAFTSESNWATINDSWGYVEQAKAMAGLLVMPDINQDGKVDLCFPTADNKLSCSINKGSFSDLKSYGVLTGLKSDVSLFDSVKHTGGMNPLRFTEINSDGAMDYCYRASGSIKCTLGDKVNYAQLNKVTDPLGNYSKIYYSLLSDPYVYTQGSSAVAPQKDITPYSNVVSKVIKSNGIGGERTAEYTYSGLVVDPVLGSLGFASTVSKDVLTDKSYTSQYFQNEIYKGKLKKSIEKIGNKTLNTIDFEYIKLTGANSYITAIHPKKVTENAWDLDGTKKFKKTVTSTNYNNYGLPKDVVENTVAGGQSYIKTINTRYKQDVSNWVINKPEKITVTHNLDGKTVTKNSSFTYYPNTGDLLTETIEPDHIKSTTKTHYYDGFGNTEKTVLTASGEVARTNKTNYDASRGIFVINQSNTKGHSESFTPDGVCNKPETHTGPNKLITRWKYDNFCRKATEVSPSPNSITTSWHYAWSEGYNPGFGRNDTSVFKITQKQTGTTDVTEYFDSENREVRKVTTGFSGQIFQDKIYNARGLIEQASLPYYQGAFPASRSQWVTAEYDKLGRMLEEKKPTNNYVNIITKKSYSGLTLTTTDEVGNVKTIKNGVLGKPVKITEPNSSTLVYTYTADGNLFTTTIGGIETSRINYDDFGQKKDLTDFSMGKTSYIYTPYGDLEKQTDANGNITYIEYDEIGRPDHKRQTNGTTNKVIETDWVYDTLKIGKVTSVTNGNVTTLFTYDSKGRAKTSTVKIDGQSFTNTIDYDTKGRPYKQTFPDAVSVKRSYDSRGQIQNISIPKSDIWDYDYVKLDQSLAKLKQEITDLSNTNETALDKMAEYRETAIDAEAAAIKYEGLGDVAQAEVNTLRTEANNLLNDAKNKQAEADAAASLANDYAKKYGDLIFTLVSSNTGYATYRAEECTSTYKGGCNTTTHVEAIDLSHFDRTFCESNGKSGTVCSSGPRNSLNLGQFYSDLSNYYTAESNKLKAQSTAKTNAAQAKEQTIIADYEKQKQDSINKANDYYHQAQIQEQIAAPIANQIVQLTAAKEATQRQLDDYGLNQNGDVTLWTVTGKDAADRLTSELAGNTVLTHRTYDPFSGQLKTIKSWLPGYATSPLRENSYHYFNNNSLEKRTDHVSNITDTFTFDSLDRIKTYDSTSKTQTHYDYDALGNLTVKSDQSGTMVYKNNRLDYIALSSQANKTFRYDKVGNMTQGKGRTIVWNSFNKPNKITDDKGNVINFTYDANQNRVKKQTKNSKGVSTTTYYVGKSYELTKTDNAWGTVTQGTHFLYAGDKVVGMQIRVTEQEKGAQVASPTPDTTRYLHQGALNNVDMITDGQGKKVMSAHYDPFGKQIKTGTEKTFTNRGYTGHEQLDSVGLIHMNARLYDADLGRFLSADTYIQAPEQLLSHNRYLYVKNNPLKYSDPSGHFFKALSKFLGKLINVVLTVVAIAVMAVAVFIAAMVIAATLGATAYAFAIATMATMWAVSQTLFALQKGADIGQALLYGMAQGIAAAVTLSSISMDFGKMAEFWKNPINGILDILDLQFRKTKVGQAFHGAKNAYNYVKANGLNDIYKKLGGWSTNLGSKLGNKIKTFLDSPFEKEMFTRYWSGIGETYKLTKAQFIDMLAKGKKVGSNTLDLYGSKEYDQAIGRGTLNTDSAGNITGFTDSYNFDWKSFGVRPLKNEFQTRSVDIAGQLVGAKKFNICFGTGCLGDSI